MHQFASDDDRSTRALPKERSRARWLAGFAWLAVPTAAELWIDLHRRSVFLQSLDAEQLRGYAWSSLRMLIIGAGLIVLGAYSRRWVRLVCRVLLVVLAVTAVGFQTYTFTRYQAYMDDRAVLLGTALLPSIGQQLMHDRLSVALSLGPPLAYALGAPWVLRWLWGDVLAGRSARASKIRGALRDVVICTLLLTMYGKHVEYQQASPSSLYVHAMGQYSRARWDHNETVERVHPGPRSPAPVPPLTPIREPRNVIFVLTESVRADFVCSAPAPECEVTPFTNAALPDRIPLLRMRALGSTTALSIATMWSGLPPESSREDNHTAPLIWEYARAAGIGTAYYTAQNMLFGNSGKWLEATPFDRQVSATHLEPDPPLEVGAKDSLLYEYVAGDLSKLKQPYVAVVHLSNTHYPYRFPDADAPFQPESVETGPYYKKELINRYKDAVYHQDRGLAEMIQKLRAQPAGKDAVIVFFSDHAEQLHEHGAHGHTGTLYDTEIHIPGWIDAPPGTLSAEERAALASLRDVPLTTLDVFPTLMDLLGLWEPSNLGAFREKIGGQSLLRGGSSPDMPHVLTNCSGLWACAFKNWGAMQRNRKVMAMQGDREWRCVDTDVDPDELKLMPLEHCADLIPLAESQGRPFGTP